MKPRAKTKRPATKKTQPARGGGQPPSTPDLIVEELKGIQELLLAKNKKYGDSALNPERCFSRASATEQLLVRIDDKLSRIKTLGFRPAEDEDTLQDLIGYLVLLKVALRKQVA